MSRAGTGTILIGVKPDKLVCLQVAVPATLLFVLTGYALASDGVVQPGGVVALDRTQRTFLSRIARRTVNDAVRGRPTYQPTFVPAPLTAKHGEAIVRLRHAGYLLASASSGPGPMPTVTRDAALAAVEMWTKQYGRGSDLLDAILIEIEVVGPPEPVPTQVDWTVPRALDPYIEPGVHGLVLRGPTVHQRFTPTELITSDMVLSEALKKIAQKSHSSAPEVTKTRVMRFRTEHWYQDAPGHDIVSLHRGLTPVGIESVSEDGLDASIAALGEYMIYRQQPSGRFTYQYEPAWDRYVDEENVVRQVGATMSLSAYAKTSGRDGATAGADTAIRFHLQGLRDVPGRTDASYVATADQRNKLGVTALLCLSLSEHPTPEVYADTRRKLANGMLLLQQPTGMFVTGFPPAREVGAQDYFPGEALLALAGHYELEPSSAVQDAFDRAIGFYRDYFRNRPSPAFVPWQAQAFGKMARLGKRQDYADFVFEITDWLAEKQLTPDNCEWSELWGGIASYQPGRAGISTASYLEGFAEALTVARAMGDAARANRYEKLVRHAARFVMQLQFRSDEAYFVRSVQDTVGAVRATPSLNLLRIDHCQHALSALMKTRQVLFGDER